MAGWYDDFMGANTPAAAPQITSTPWRAAQVDAPAQMAAPESVPVTMSSNGLTPAPDTSGLYAIYGRKNPAQASADRYSRMAGMDMGGRLGQLPGIVATFMAGKKQKEADAIEATKQKDIEDYTKQLSAYNKLKEDKTLLMQSGHYLKDVVYPMATNIWVSSLDKNSKLPDGTPNPDAHAMAGKDAADFINSQNEKMGGVFPTIGSFSPDQQGAQMSAKMKDGTYQAIIAKKSGAITDLDGNEIDNSKIMLIGKSAELLKSDLETKAEADRAAAAKQKSEKTANIVTDTARLNQLGKIIALNPDPSFDKDIPGLAVQRAEYNRLLENPRLNHNSVSGSGQAPAPAAPAPQAPVVDPKRAKAIAQLESSKNPLTEANIAYVMKQIQ